MLAEEAINARNGTVTVPVVDADRNILWMNRLLYSPSVILNHGETPFLGAG